LKQGFFKDSCSQSGDRPENILAKFAYMLDMKVEKDAY
jgi:hypothetical protein